MLTVLGDTVPSYRLSNFVGPAGIAASAMAIRPTVGRGIDELERESDVTRGDASASRDTSLSLSEDGRRDTELARRPSVMFMQREREGGEALAFMSESYLMDFGTTLSGRSLVEVEDNRRFHPDDLIHGGSKTVRGQLARAMAASAQASIRPNTFRTPASVITCIRRYARRRVLLAKGRGGRVGPPRYHPKTWC